MSAEELREKLVVKFAMKLGLDVDDAHDFANALIAIVCEQRQALEEHWCDKKNDPRECHHCKALRDTDERLKAMGVL